MTDALWQFHLWSFLTWVFLNQQITIFKFPRSGLCFKGWGFHFGMSTVIPRRHKENGEEWWKGWVGGGQDWSWWQPVLEPPLLHRTDLRIVSLWPGFSWTRVSKPPLPSLLECSQSCFQLWKIPSSHPKSGSAWLYFLPSSCQATLLDSKSSWFSKHHLITFIIAPSHNELGTGDHNRSLPSKRLQ